MSRSAVLILACLVIGGPALAAEPSPDRSTLSYEENVIINTACAAARRQSNNAFNDCVARQVRDLQDHPSPDRSSLSAAQNRSVERKCEYLRRTGIADYNDCLRRAMAVSASAADGKPDDALGPNYLQVFTQRTAEAAPAKPAATPVAATSLPRPAAALPKRPDRFNTKSLSPADLFKKVQRSVWVVVATASLADAQARDVAQGSAIAVSEHLLLTNCHVVNGRELIKIVQDNTIADAKLVAADLAPDRCVIRAIGLTLVPVAGVRPFDDLAVGERVFAIGAPVSLERTLSEGLLSGLRRLPGHNLVQTSAAISPGSSGGGLFDERGNLIGITTLELAAMGVQNLNFAIAAADYWN